MKTAEEVAEAIVSAKELQKGATGYGLKLELVKILNVFTEERVKEARAEALEVAATVADFTAEAVKENHVWEPSNLAMNIAHSIRSLKDKP